MKDTLKTIVICIIVFFGSAFAIMSFNEDVAIDELFQKIYQLVEGGEHDGFGILECAYGIGVALRITVFFNHFGNSKNGQPTPIELKMQQYDDDISTYLQSKNKSSSGKKQQRGKS